MLKLIVVILFVFMSNFVKADNATQQTIYHLANTALYSIQACVGGDYLICEKYNKSMNGLSHYCSQGYSNACQISRQISVQFVLAQSYSRIR